MPDQKLKLKKPSFAFLVCVAIAIAAWFVVTFSKDYRVTQEYRIVCCNLPEGKEAVTVSDSVISLTFNQKGLKYLSKPYSDKDKVVYVSINDLIKPKNKVSVYTFTNKEMRDFLARNNFGSELVWVEAPEVITFYLH